MAEQEKSKRRLISEFQRRKNAYIATYKRIKRLVENAAGQAFDDATRERFRVAALESNKAHKEYREFLLPFFSDAAIKEVFPEEAFAEENDNLKGTVQELQRNKQVLDALVQELSDKCSAQNEKIAENDKLNASVSALQKQLDELRAQNVELKKAMNGSEALSPRRARKYSDQRSDQRDMLMRDLEHRLSFRSKGQQNGNRRDRYIETSLEKIYKINEYLEGIANTIDESFVKPDTNFFNLRDLVIQKLIELEDVSSNGRVVIRSERALVIKKAQTLLDVLNSKCS